MTRMMESRSTRVSSDNESDVSHMQRQAVSGTLQARSSVERDNQRQERGVSMVVCSLEDMPCSDSENLPSTSQ